MLDKAIDISKNHILTIYNNAYIVKVLIARIKSANVVVFNLKGRDRSATSSAYSIIGILLITIVQRR
jgi:hypothetical protein